MKNNENFKLILSSTLPLIIVVILSIVGGGMAVKYLLEFSSRVSDAQVEESVLMTKLSLLKTVSARIGQDSSASSVALPDANPALAVFTQIKNQSSSTGVLVNELRTGAGVSEEVQNISKVGISFILSGPRLDVFRYIENLQTLAPIIVVNSIDFTESAGIMTAEVKVQSFWAKLPTTISGLTEPVSELTEGEVMTLEKVSRLTRATASNLPEPLPGGKDDPFAEVSVPVAPTP